jgi:hypothetical protein
MFVQKNAVQNYQNVIKETGNDYAAVVADGVDAADVGGYVDTGSYIFNALVSGSIYGGLPNNKITAIAGESANRTKINVSIRRYNICSFRTN